jgi:hypothetical protein
MGYRYRIARAMGRKDFEEAVDEDKELLAQFDARLMSVQGGIRAALECELKSDGKVHPWNLVGVDEKTWEWLRPLLVELAGHRVGARMAAN